MAILIAVCATMTNYLKPLTGLNAVWKRDRISLQASYFYPVEQTWRAINQLVPQDAVMGYTGTGSVNTYFLFGRNLMRKVYWISEKEITPFSESIVKNQVRYLLDCEGNGKNISGFHLLSQTIGYGGVKCLLYENTEGKDYSRVSEYTRNKLLNGKRTAWNFNSVIQVAPELRDKVGLALGYYLPTEMSTVGSYYGAGMCDSRNFTASLWAEEPMDVKVRMKTKKWTEGTPETELILTLTYPNIDKVPAEYSKIATGEEEFMVHLEGGTNLLTIRASDNQPCEGREDQRGYLIGGLLFGDILISP